MDTIKAIAGAMLIFGLLLLGASDWDAEGAELRLVTRGPGGSLVTNDARMKCKQAACRRLYGSEWITVQAYPWRGWELSSWAGSCRGAGLCRVHTSRAHTVRATWKRSERAESRLKVYTQSGDYVGDLAGADAEQQPTTVVVQRNGITAIYNRATGDMDFHPGFAFWTGPNCTGDMLTKLPPGTAARTQAELGVITTQPDAAVIPDAVVYSVNVGTECENGNEPWIEGDLWPGSLTTGNEAGEFRQFYNETLVVR